MFYNKNIRFVSCCCLLVVWLFCSCQVARTLVYNFAGINDYKKFPFRTLEKPVNAFVFPKSSQPLVPKTFNYTDSIQIPFDEFLKKSNTVAFLIIQHDSIQYEAYFKEYSRGSVIPSFSMAKSVLSILVGMAIEDGYISSVHDSVTKYIPKMKDKSFRKVTIENLLQMTSGLRFNESYMNPFGDAAGFYYGKNLERKTKKLPLENPPGSVFEYTSGSSQILGLLLNNALPKGMSITAYAEEKIWKPLGMQYGATWSMDEKDGIEKTFCCLNARAVDFAKIGRLYLHSGNWNKRQLIPKSWVENSTKIDTSGASPWFYQYQWWLPTKNGDFTARGLLGQYIYVNPEKDLIVVRLGKNEGEVSWMDMLPLLASYY